MFKDSNLFILIITIIFTIILYGGFKIIFSTIQKKIYHDKLAKSGIHDIDKMDGLQFEIYLKALFKELGYKTVVTKGSNDFGADLIAIKNNVKIVIQAKRYKYKNNVGISAVQQIYASIPYYKANKGLIITNSLFTKNAKILASRCNIKLIDRKGLVKLINKVTPSITPLKIKQTVKPKERKCPLCNNQLVIRHNKSGDEFFGCSQYPNCKHTEPIAK